MADRFFRYEGTNWEGRPFYVAEPVRQIGIAMATAWPLAHHLDGTVASEDHDARSKGSDHRPRPFTGRGVVRAIDFGVRSDGEGELLAGIMRRVPTVNYVLFGANVGHPGHVHVSTNPDYDHDARKVHVFTQDEVRELKQLYAEAETLRSDVSSGFRVLIELAREERDKPLHDHPGGPGGDGGLGYGDKVDLRGAKLVRP